MTSVVKINAEGVGHCLLTTDHSLTRSLALHIVNVTLYTRRRDCTRRGSDDVAARLANLMTTCCLSTAHPSYVFHISSSICSSAANVSVMGA